MEAKPAPSTNLLALPDGTELVGDYRIKRVLGAGGFGITYLADETALGRLVTIKEYFPAEFAARRDCAAVPRSRGVTEEYQWGLDRFIEEAQTLARFDHPNIVRVHRYFRANNTGYMVLHFEEGGSFKAWLKGLKRPPRQDELDKMLAPLLDALELIHNANFLHRDIAPDNIMVRKDGSPVLIDFGSARGSIAGHSHTLSALVKPGYSPYEQYATSGANQGPWTDIYALGATLYHAITGKRPPDAPSRVVEDEYVPAREAALCAYRGTFLDAVDKSLRIELGERPQRIAEWRDPLLAIEAEPRTKTRTKPKSKPKPKPKPERTRGRTGLQQPIARGPRRARGAQEPAVSVAVASLSAADVATRSLSVPASLVPAPPDAPQRKGQLLDFIDALKRRRPAAPELTPARASPAIGRRPAAGRLASLLQRLPPDGFGVASQPATTADPQTATPSLPSLPQSPAQPAEAEPVPPVPAERTRMARRTILRIPLRHWRTGLSRVAAAIAVASLIVAYQESLTRAAPPASSPGPKTADSGASTAVMELKGHQGPVVGVASSDQKGWIVSAGTDSTIRVWSASSGGSVRVIPVGEGPITAFALDEQRALVGHKNGAVVLWDLESGEKLSTFQYGPDAVTSLAFLNNGFVAARQDGSVALFDLGTPATPAVLQDGQERGGLLVAVARSHGLVVSNGLDHTVRVWTTPEPRLVRTYRLTDASAAIGISPDASYVAGGSTDGTVRVQYNAALHSVPLHPAQTFKAHEGRVQAIALGPAGLLASAGADGVKLWSLRPAAHMLRMLDAGQVQTLSFSHDGRRLFAGGQDGIVRVWSLPAPPAAGAT